MIIEFRTLGDSTQEYIAVQTPYDPAFVASVKAIAGARWDAVNKEWIVSKAQETELRDLIAKHYENAEWRKAQSVVAELTPGRQAGGTPETGIMFEYQITFRIKRVAQKSTWRIDQMLPWAKKITVTIPWTTNYGDNPAADAQAREILKAEGPALVKASQQAMKTMATDKAAARAILEAVGIGR